MVAPITVDSNVTGLSIAEEVYLTPKILPGTPIWYRREPNSYSNLGQTVKVVTRDPINPTRQNLKGGTVDIDAAAAFNEDLCQDNMTRLLQGFFCADALEHYSLIPLNGTANPLLSVVAATGVYNVTTSLAGLIRAGDLVFASNFANSVNNGLSKAVTITTTTLDTDSVATVTEGATAGANIQVVGFEFAAGDLVATISSGTLVLTSVIKDLTQLGLRVGEWIFIGGDAVGTQFANGVGYARVLSVTSTVLTLDKSTGLVSADAGAGKTIRIFFGTYERNAILDTDVKFRTYQIERSLGNDGVGTQAEYLEGCFSNTFAIKIPTANKVEVDLAYIALNDATRTGAVGLKSGTRVAGLGQGFYNTSSHLYRLKMNLIDGTLVPSSQFAFVTDLNINIDNGMKLNKAVGVIGGISASASNFTVKGAVTAYFSTVAAIAAVRANSDVTIDAILAKDNQGLIYDLPRVSLSGGQAQVVKHEPIKIPIEQMAVQCAGGYTLGHCIMHYLPTIAMPVAQ